MSSRLELAQTVIDKPKPADLARLTAADEALDGRWITIGGHRVINFGSCSYLGLETDRRLIDGAQRATARYGTAFSTTRAYLSAPLYARLTALLSRIAGGRPVAVGSSATLVHASALPVLVGLGDVVAYDAQVHHSLQAVLPTLAAHGARCESVPHQRLDRVEEIAAANRGGRTFYLAHGIYGMRGDTLPVEGLTAMLDRQPNLWAYIDDAHGAAWTGRHGAGWVMGRRRVHERMFVVVGMAKAFAAAGAFIVCPTPELADAIFSCGAPSIVSGPLSPPVLGAAIAAAELLLSNELASLQERMLAQIRRFDAAAAGLGLRVIPGRTPIKFVEVGSAQRAAAVCRRLLVEGYFANAVYPAVGVNGAGLRVSLSLHQTADDVTGVVQSLHAATA